jgi:hypothetical protein
VKLLTNYTQAAPYEGACLLPASGGTRTANFSPAYAAEAQVVTCLGAGRRLQAAGLATGDSYRL